jgi:hypothetical protein
VTVVFVHFGDQQIQRVLLKGKIVKYGDLSPLHLLPYVRLTIKTNSQNFFYLCLFPQETGDDRGIIIFPDHKAFWFAVLKD